jgi:hypothetical protein
MALVRKSRPPRRVDARRNLTMQVLTALVFSAVLAFGMASRGADLSVSTQKAFDAFCGRNLRYIEALFDATRTTCRTTGYLHGSMIVFTAEQPVFRVPAARKAWVMAAVLTAGKTIRDLGGSLIGIDYVGLTDSERAKSGKVARLPASFADHLQAAVHDGKIDAAVAVEDLDPRLRFEP